jgi:hypothetical protein
VGLDRDRRIGDGRTAEDAAGAHARIVTDETPGPGKGPDRGPDEWGAATRDPSARCANTSC